MLSKRHGWELNRSLPTNFVRLQLAPVVRTVEAPLLIVAEVEAKGVPSRTCANVRQYGDNPICTATLSVQYHHCQMVAEVAEILPSCCRNDRGLCKLMYGQKHVAQQR